MLIIMIKAQLSLYIFNYNGDRGEIIREFWKILKENHFKFISNSFSTIVWTNDDKKLFEVLYFAYEKFKNYGIVFDIKISNIGPYPEFEIRDDEL
ncbi:MAG: hypothetical protein ABIL76_08005 [candidate division WOR-3 bacterium]